MRSGGAPSPAHEFFDTPAETHFPPFSGLSIHPFASKRACQDNFFVAVPAGSHPTGDASRGGAGATDWLLALQGLHVGYDALGQTVEPVTAFEHGDDPSLAKLIG